MADIDRGPETVNYNRVPVGLNEPLQWGLGDKSGPQPLAGRQAVLYLNPGTPAEQRIPLVVSASGLYWEWRPAARWTGTLRYVLMGQISQGGEFRQLAQGSISLGNVFNIAPGAP